MNTIIHDEKREVAFKSNELSYYMCKKKVRINRVTKTTLGAIPESKTSIFYIIKIAICE